MTATENAAHMYRYTDTSGGQTVAVTVTTQDSFRSLVTIAVNGKPYFDEALVDDAIAIRLRDPKSWNPAANTPLAPLLASGNWVVDPAAAPPVLSTDQSQDVTTTGKDPLSDGLDAFEYVTAVSAEAFTIVKFNKDDLNYRPDEDPFRGLVDADIQNGLQRYDAVPPGLPRSPSTQGGAARLPDSRFFRRLSIYVKHGEVARVLEHVSFEDQPDMKKAKKEGKPKFLLNQLAQLREGIGDNPVRQRDMEIEVLDVGGNITVSIPPNAARANLGSLIRSGALLRLPGLKQAPRRPPGLGAVPSGPSGY